MASSSRSGEPVNNLPSTLRRFSLADRIVHWTFAALMTSCLLTAAVLYNGALAVPIGHRRAIELVHVYSGFALPVPILLGGVSASYRANVRRLNRFTGMDWRWLRSRDRRNGSIRVGKFNAGQKLNACLTWGSVLVLLGTGIIMFFPDLVRLSWRTGATFAHDWFALALGLLVLGHITYAIRDRESRTGMLTGDVLASWARSEHSAWAEELGVGQGEGDDADEN
jgi:formate dehydrogenase subunit gamma